MNNTASLNVVTYNMGGSKNDFSWVCAHNGIEPTNENYEITQQKTAAYFKDLASREQVDVIMLQEVFEKERPLLKELKNMGFKLLNVEKTKKKESRNKFYNDCAILVRKDRFKDILNSAIIIKGGDTPIVIATDKKTNHRVMFVTAHVPGCNLEENRVDPQDAEFGDTYIQAMINKIDELSQLHQIKIQIFGADMNANPEKLNQNRTAKEQWNHRFKMLEAAGFQTHRTNETTEVYPKGTYRERELDFIFSRETKSNESFFRKLFWGEEQPAMEIGQTSVLLNFGLDTDNLPHTASDHRPVMSEFTLQPATKPPLASDWEVINNDN